MRQSVMDVFVCFNRLNRKKSMNTIVNNLLLSERYLCGTGQLAIEYNRVMFTAQFGFLQRVFGVIIKSDKIIWALWSK